MIFVLGIGVVIIALFLEIPVLEFVYGIELKEFYASAIIIIFGSVFYGASVIISSILIAMRKTLSQVIAYIACAIGSTLLADQLIETMEIQGAAITYTATMITIVTIFVMLVIKRLVKYKGEWK